jgi:multidrug efflux pump subunit AcrA (membrane-fusion protein)
MGKKKKVIKGIIVIVAGAIIIMGYTMYNNAPQSFTVQRVSYAPIQEVVDVSGNVESENTKAYYSNVSATIKDLTVKRGDSIKAGDQLLTYDTADLTAALEQAKLSTRANEDGYQSTINNNAKNSANYTNASTSLEILEQQIADEKSYISNIQESLANAQEVTSEITEVTTKIASTTDTKELKKLQNQLDNLQEEYDGYNVSSLSGDLAYHQTELTQCLTSQSEYKAQQKTADASIIDSAARDQLKAGGDSAKITQTQTEEELAKANQGIVAEIDGIITTLNAEEGAFVPEGTRLLVVESSTELKVVVNVSKYDIGKIEFGQRAIVTVAGEEYEATVSKINKMADVDASDKPQVSVEIHIENPGDKIYLGLEADVDIYTNEKSNTLTIASAAVYTDDEGTYCYTIQNGVIAKKYFTKGIESEDSIEIVNGLSEEEVVITDSITDSSLGKKATAVE